MNIDPASAVANDIVGSQWKKEVLHELKDKKAQVDAVAKQFEGVLVRQFLDEALEPLYEGESLFGTDKSPMLDHIIKDTLTNAITEQKSLGFSSVLQAKLFNEVDDVKSSNTEVPKEDLK